MDPSYNNPQYYPPTQQDSPTQQGYPLVNSYQCDQHPQTSYSVPNANNNLNELDQGCFKFYKAAWRIWNFVTLIRLIFYIGGFYPSDLITIMLYASSMALVFIQLSAMKDRDLKKAKMALIGFLGYTFICVVIRILVCLRFNGGLNWEFLLRGFLWISLDAILTVIGSFKVFQLLSANQIKSESENYQSFSRA